MNWYFYWYYTIYSIYKNYSKDNYFDIFATGLFSFFVSSLIIGVLSYLFVFINIPNILFSKSVITIIIFILVFIINYIIFLPKKQQIKRFEKYKTIQKRVKDLFAIVLCIISFGIYFSVLILGKTFFEG